MESEKLCVRGITMKIKRLLLVLMLTTMFLLPALMSGAQMLDERAKPISLEPRKKPAPPPDPVGGGGSEITGQRYALIIGISDYEGDSSDLTYADDDALDWYDYFNGLGYNIMLLLDGQATKANILAGFQWLADMENEAGDSVVITYSGHGYYSRTGGESCIISWELAGVWTSEIKAITDTFQSEHVFFFDDACNQGTMVNLVGDGWVAAIGSTTKTYTYDGTADMANGIYTYYAIHEAIEIYGMTSAEDISNWATQRFDETTRGDATVYDTFTIGEMYF